MISQMPDNVTLHKNSSVSAIEYQQGHQDGSFHLMINDNTAITANNVIITTPPDCYKHWFMDDNAFDTVRQMSLGSCAITMMSFDRASFNAELKGNGFVITRATQTPLTACTFISNKWTATVPKDRVVLRAFIGKPGDSTIANHSNAELGEIALHELQRILHFSAKPQWVETNRLVQSIPQYTVGHLDRVAKLKQHVATTYPGLFLIGTPYGGVGMPDCIRQAKTAVERLTQEYGQ
ncbi:protoporphyrinogen oxidase [Limosilactobacillus antri DSM 16041]|uniref:Coproporphyrinogen III oxidase n=1 Tax=Limosilactobacillus antri DSM 16041 TaxID=525309 RepID=A0ABR5NZ75_9LACO|nr:protoporphyrinogen oxidase [Limosilactobacillus antri DSM 16041]